jgi:hypothetical protein
VPQLVKKIIVNSCTEDISNNLEIHVVLTVAGSEGNRKDQPMVDWCKEEKTIKYSMLPQSRLYILMRSCFKGTTYLDAHVPTGNHSY